MPDLIVVTLSIILFHIAVTMIALFFVCRRLPDTALPAAHLVYCIAADMSIKIKQNRNGKWFWTVEGSLDEATSRGNPTRQYLTSTHLRYANRARVVKSIQRVFPSWSDDP